MSGSDRNRPVGDRWLLLIHQLPAKPAYLRVKIWRRLQALGAVPVKNSVYALPAGAEAQEDFEWLMGEITEGGGEAIICEARLIEGLDDRKVRAHFSKARDADYDELAKEARVLEKTLRKSRTPDALTEARSQLARLKSRLDHILSIDFFGADGRESAAGLINAIEDRLAQPNMVVSTDEPQDFTKELRGRVWVTRFGVHVDRMASAWLIRRFIDPSPQFKFVPSRGYKPEPGELRFDMTEGEFTHVGDRCTFEVLLERANVNEPGLRAIAEIVHDIDLKDAKYARPETQGIKTLITGICMASDDDEERIRRGSAVFDDLHQYFGKSRS